MASNPISLNFTKSINNNVLKDNSNSVKRYKFKKDNKT